MHLSTPDLSTTVLIIVGAASILVARKARRRTAELKAAAMRGDADAVATARRESTIAMVAIVVGAVAFTAALSASLHP
jgi:hypothetical protein